MKLSNILAATAVAAVTLGSAFAANASLVFVGSWTPYDSPVSWNGEPPNGPLAYTGQEAAALLFGGAASSYVISTISDQVADINHMSWYDVIGVGGNVLAENWNNKYLGQFYGPTSGYCNVTCDVEHNAASAYIHDNGVSGRNYAFRDDTGAVPEPATWGLMIMGFGLSGAALRSRRRMATAAV